MILTENKVFYTTGETIWIKEEKRTGIIVSLNITAHEAVVQTSYHTLDSGGITKKTLKLWEISKYRPRKKDKKLPTIYWAKVRQDAIIPSKREEDGCYDIYACFDENEIVIKPSKSILIPTGIASALPTNFRFNAKRERGSTGIIAMEVLAGQIDSGFRGEWFILLHNSSDRTIVISKSVNASMVGDFNGELVQYYPYKKAIAQAALEEVPVVNEKEISYEELQKMSSERGSGMLGSSNK